MTDTELTSANPSQSPSGSMSSRGPRYWWIVFAVGAVALGIDQVTKWWALDHLVVGQDRPFVGRFITLQLLHNPGAAFSLGEGATWVFTVLSVAVIGVLCWYAFRVRSWFPALLAGLILGGAAGNLLDRLFQPPAFGRGYVVDFLNYNGWFVGNVADIWIVVGAIAFAIYLTVESGNASDHDAAKTDGFSVQSAPGAESDE